MAATFSLAWEVKGSAGGRAIGAGGMFAPATYTSSDDLLFSRRVPITASTVTTVYSDTGANGELTDATIIIVVPSVDGNIGWENEGTASESSTAMNWKAGVPLVFPTGKDLDYNADASTRASSTANFVSKIYFYTTSSGGYVEVMAIK